MQYWLKLVGTTEDPVDRWDEDYVNYARQPAVRKGDLLVLQATRHRRLIGIVKCTSDPIPNKGFKDQWGTHRTTIKDILPRRSPVAAGPHVRNTNFKPRSYGPELIEITKEDYEDAVAALSSK